MLHMGSFVFFLIADKDVTRYILENGIGLDFFHWNVRKLRAVKAYRLYKKPEHVLK